MTSETAKEQTGVVGKSGQNDGTVLVSLFVIFACAKLLLVSGEEVIARNQGLDDLWHIGAAFRGYWFGHGYNHVMFVHLPVYSLWIALVHFTGIPLRVATELLYLAASGVLLLSLLRTGISRWLGIVILVIVMFHPVSYTLFDYVLAETIYCSLFIMAVACFVTLWLRRDQIDVLRWGAVTGIVCALLWNCRKENELLILLFAVLAGFSFFERLKAGDGWLAAVIKSFKLICLPLVIVALLTLAIMTANFFRFGLFVPTEFSAPGYKAAYRALLRIDPPHPVRFVPVTAEVRKMAYRVSPAFNELAWYFEGDLGYQAASETRKHMGIQGEISAGWFYWTLRDAAASSGHHRSAREADAYYQRIADEINGAIDAGKLAGRRVVTTFLDPEPSNYLPYIPESFQKIWRLFTTNDPPPKPADDPGVPLNVRHAFDLMANRRVALVPPEVVTVQGWAFSDKDRLARVEVQTVTGEKLASSAMTPRDDIVKAFGPSFGREVTLNSGFKMDVVIGGRNPKDLSLVFVGNNGAETALPYTGIKADTPIEERTSTQGILKFALDSKEESLLYKKLTTVQASLWQVHGRLVTMFTWLGAFALLLLMVLWRRIDIWSPRFVAIVLLIVAVVSRVALFTLLDASSWPGNQPRYLFPVMPLYSCLLFLLINESWQTVIAATKWGGNHESPNQKGDAL